MVPFILSNYLPDILEISVRKVIRDRDIYTTLSRRMVKKYRTRKNSVTYVYIVYDKKNRNNLKAGISWSLCSISIVSR